MPSRFLSRLGGLLLLTLALAPALHAQTRWLSLTEVSVRPEHVNDWMELVRTEINPALQRGGLASRYVWRSTGLVGDPFVFVMAVPMDRLEGGGSNAVLERELGTERFTALMDRAGSYLTRAHRTVYRTRDDMSFDAERSGPPVMAVVTTVRVARGRKDAYVAYVRDSIVPAFRQADVTHWGYETMWGGDANEFVTVALREGFDDLERGPVIDRTIGAEAAAALYARLPNDVVVSQERTLIRFVPELSILPAQTTQTTRR